MTTRITIDGVEHEVADGQDLLSACLSRGVALPYFCWHGALGSVGACRQCAVRVYSGPDDQQGRIVMACLTPVAPGQRVAVADPEATRFRAQVSEWLMLNHPHDCPVCEEAGSCHLQDMVVATGHRTRRTRFPKRTHRNQDLGPLLTHEMNRCIACYRCTRFYRDYAGGRDLDVFGAHDNVYFGRAEDGPLQSPFAGNLAEVCPTGVFNDKGWSADYRRKWDMRATASVCPHCSVGCNILVAERDGRVRRVQNRYHAALNGYFLCDRGRYGPLHVEAQTRLREAQDSLEAGRAAIAAGAIGLGSPRASLEANFALRRLVGPDRFFAAVSDEEAATVACMAAVLRAGPARIASLRDIEQADAALVLGIDLTNAAPRVALALRQMTRGAERALAAQKGVPDWLDQGVRTAGEGQRSPLILATPTPDALDALAMRSLRLAPPDVTAFGHAVSASIAGRRDATAAVDATPASASPVAHTASDATNRATSADIAATAAALSAAERPLVVAGADAGAVDAAAAIAAALGPHARIALLPPEANSLGLALLGATRGVESAAGASTVIVLEADLFERAPHASLQRLLGAARMVIVLDSLATPTTARADILLPVAAFAEAAGTFVNFEGRAQRLHAAVPDGAPAAWRTLAALGAGDWPDLDALLAEIDAELPGVAAASPNAQCATPQGRIARTPRPRTGRTADDRAGRLPEAVPPRDPDSPLSWGMEGARGETVPPALLAAYTLPGLHSANAVTRFQEEINGPLRGGDPGVRLIAPGCGDATHTAPAPGDSADAQSGGLWLVGLSDAFTGTETSRASALLAARAPAPRLLLHPDDAAALGLAAGDRVTLDGDGITALLALEPGLARGVVAASLGTLVPRGPLRRVRLAREK